MNIQRLLYLLRSKVLSGLRLALACRELTNRIGFFMLWMRETDDDTTQSTPIPSIDGV